MMPLGGITGGLLGVLVDCGESESESRVSLRLGLGTRPRPLVVVVRLGDECFAVLVAWEFEGGCLGK